jgi:excisionase family DNA binding protein
MTGLLAGPAKAVSLPVQEAKIARESSAALSHLVTADTKHLTLRLKNQQTGEQIEATVPAVVMRMLAEMLSQMAEGHSITLVPLNAELSTQQCADLLGVSRPYFIKLLEQGQIPYRKVGEQRRVRYHDLLAYIEAYQKEATAALDEMAAEAQQSGLYNE